MRRKSIAHASVEQFTHLLLEATENARFGLTNSRGTHLQGFGDRRWAVTVDDGHPECLPGTSLELSADLIQGPSINLADLGFLKRDGIGFYQLVEGKQFS